MRKTYNVILFAKVDFYYILSIILCILMEKILPIKDENQVRDVLSKLRQKDEKYYLLFVIGINSGMPLENILKLKVLDPKRDDAGLLSDSTANHWLDESLFIFIGEYVRKERLSKGQYLFRSRKVPSKPICPVQFYRVLKECGRQLGISGIGTQTMRKTFGWFHYKENGDLNCLRRILGKRSLDATAEYIGVERPRQNVQTGRLVRKIAL